MTRRRGYAKPRRDGWEFSLRRGGWFRDDADGTTWTIRVAVDGSATRAMTYRDHRLTSRHTDVEAAVWHHADMVAMFTARNADAYAYGGVTAVNLDDTNDTEAMF